MRVLFERPAENQAVDPERYRSSEIKGQPLTVIVNWPALLKRGGPMTGGENSDPTKSPRASARADQAVLIRHPSIFIAFATLFFSSSYNSTSIAVRSKRYSFKRRYRKRHGAQFLRSSGPCCATTMTHSR
jgi:hypothetical protein